MVNFYLPETRSPRSPNNVFRTSKRLIRLLSNRRPFANKRTRIGGHSLRKRTNRKPFAYAIGEWEAIRVRLLANGSPFVYVRLAFAANIRRERSERSFDVGPWGYLHCGSPHLYSGYRLPAVSPFNPWAILMGVVAKMGRKMQGPTSNESSEQG